jgi:hypothetical protein
LLDNPKEKKAGGLWTRPPSYNPFYGRATNATLDAGGGSKARLSASAVIAETAGVAEFRGSDLTTFSTMRHRSTICAGDTIENGLNHDLRG